MQYDNFKYYKMMMETLSKIDKNQKPTLLLHSCCGPCNCYPMELLNEYFNITLYFNNSNIYPLEEYQIRLDELINYLDYFNKKENANINIIVTPYDNNFCNLLSPLKDQKEGNERCKLCYKLRMQEAYLYAKEKGFDYFTTVMTISRQKSSKILNEIGEQLYSEDGPLYLFSDFKKNKGIDKGLEIAKKLNMYRQKYCGCLYSMKKED